MFSHAIPSMAQTVQVGTGVFPRLMLDHLCQLWCCYVLMLLASCFLPNPLPCFFTNLRSALCGTRWCFPQGRVFKHNRDNRKTVPKMKGGFLPWPCITSIPLSLLFHFQDLRRLGRPMERMVLVDNSPVSLALCLDNGVIVSSWTCGPVQTTPLKCYRSKSALFVNALAKSANSFQ